VPADALFAFGFSGATPVTGQRDAQITRTGKFGVLSVTRYGWEFLDEPAGEFAPAPCVPPASSGTGFPGWMNGTRSGQVLVLQRGVLALTAKGPDLCQPGEVHGLTGSTRM